MWVKGVKILEASSRTIFFIFAHRRRRLLITATIQHTYYIIFFLCIWFVLYLKGPLLKIQNICMYKKRHDDIKWK